MSKLIDLEVLDKENPISALELIMIATERSCLAGNVAEDQKNRVEKLVLKIEGLMQDLSDDSNQVSVFTLKKIDESVKIILPILQSDDLDNQSIIIIEDFLENIQKVSQKAIKKKSINEVEYLFKDFSVESLKEKLKNKNNITVVRYAGYLKDITTHISQSATPIKMSGVGSVLSSIPSVFSSDIFDEIDEKIQHHPKFGWDIEINISHKDDAKSLYSLWILIESLKSINGTEVEIKDIRKGSILAKLQVWFRSDEAKKEAEELINSTKKFAKAKLEKDYFEIEKHKSETEKIKAEREKIEKEIELTNSNEEKRRKELEIEALEIENENKRLQNERLKLQIFMEKRQAFAELLSTDVINSDQYKLIINNELQINKKSDDTLEIGMLSEKK